MEIILAENVNIDSAQVEFEAQLKDEQHFDCKVTFHCRYAKISEDILECLNEGEMESLCQNTSFGDLIKCGHDFNTSAQIIWYMVIRQSNVTNNNELWIVVKGRPLRFSKLEFALLTGLRFARGEQQFPDSDSFRNLHFKALATVKSKDILARMQLLKKKKRDNRSVSISLVRLAALYFALGVFCPFWHLADAVDSKILRLASDWEAFRSFPWGNIAYNLLLRNMKKYLREKVQKITKSSANPTHSIGGFVYPL